MTGKELFKIWAPPGARWTDWIRPVPFVLLDDSVWTNAIYNFKVPDIHYIRESFADMAVIVDLPGYEGISEGLALAGTGYRPVPLYNGTNEQRGAMALVDSHAIGQALIWGASKLKEIPIAERALPVFLLDSNRTHRFKMNPTVFDNSWDIYDQDLPSAEYFLSEGIDKIIVRSGRIQKDLNKILYKFQQKGMTIFFTAGYELPQKVSLRRKGGYVRHVKI